MLRILRHLAYEGPRHAGPHRTWWTAGGALVCTCYFVHRPYDPITDRCAPPAAPDLVTPAPPTWLAQFMSDAGRGHLPSQSHRPFIIDGGGS